MNKILIKKETTYGADQPAPGFNKLLLKSDSVSCQFKMFGGNGRIEMSKAQADRIPSNRPIWVSSSLDHNTVKPLRVVIYYRRKMRDGTVRLFLRPAPIVPSP